jgi:hypothetical protein
VSSGWTEVPQMFKDFESPARIVPLPDPYLSDLAQTVPAKRRQTPTRTLLVPLQKVQTLSDSLGQAVRDDNVEAIRRNTAEVLRLCAPHFERIVVTYRTRPFEDDPIHGFLDPAVGAKMDVRYFRDAPARQFFPEASAVFWDVPSTGLLESLACGIPTVTLLDPVRHGLDDPSAERLLMDTGVGALDAKSAADTLHSFSADAEHWGKTATQLGPFVSRFGRVSADWDKVWREFISELATPRARQNCA